ncbi:UNVERIFIED_CONTAM: F-box protein [Sesamum radiatum]|uniref:F-box protein n=1 Tax=Sesamum radiatum TaxID=300843 RepID=A0AAW2W7C9_SESRA
MRLLSFCFWKGLSFFSITKSIRNTLLAATFSSFTSIMSPKKKNSSSKVESVETVSETSVLDLPDLVLECILEKLPPEGLCRMAGVCTSLRDWCTSDHLWERHMKNKWGRIVGPAAYREWQFHVVSGKSSTFFNQDKQKGLMGYLIQLWPFALIRSSFSNISKKQSFPPVDSIMSWYLALESGKFWFPAQVYNRENGHIGFMLSCYDAELSYDQRTDTFQARYPPHGRRASAIETGVTWDRLRAPPVDTSPHDLHISDCLNELKPGDQIEIQWRRNKEFPYGIAQTLLKGWWYGVVGHLETCDGMPITADVMIAHHTYTLNCTCLVASDDIRHLCHARILDFGDGNTLVLEFNQYTRGSRWRRTTVSRKDHREEGNEADGFYGGIRKLCGKEEISMWKKLWPAEALE